MTRSNRLIIVLIVLQAVATVFLWTLDALNQVSEGTFALFVAVDLVSFAVVSYIYRADKVGEGPKRGWVAVACAMLLILVLSSIFLA